MTHSPKISCLTEPRIEALSDAITIPPSTNFRNWLKKMRH